MFAGGHAAHKDEPGWTPPIPKPPTNGPQEQKPKPAQPPLPFINMSNWDNEPVPAQEWTVPNRIPRRQCVLFSGQGGAGKSTVNLQQACAHVLGRDWLGTMPEPGPALFIDAEDEEGVIHRRLAAIARHYGVTFADLIKGGLHLINATPFSPHSPAMERSSPRRSSSNCLKLLATSSR